MISVTQFLDQYPASAEQHPHQFDSQTFRYRLCQQMHPRPDARLLPLVRDIVRRETAFRKGALYAQPAEPSPGEDDDAFEALYWAAFFLYQMGALEDVFLLWTAKMATFDTSIGLDVQFLVGRGVSATIAYVEGHEHPDAAEIAEYLRRCRESGDFDELNDWFVNQQDYF